ncbi:Uncharacterised protein [Enterobacter cloacae]|uniref:Uncharacterized protein n=1 Tax=Enterobacter cloacae TaxID=550 RepID=A0A0M7HQ43_ENTCL|nr:hypothetical protein [Enterobacter cloacae]EBK4057790.1 hypothetical protein [Salmonella enterica]AWG43827.1 hypothetical protein BFJ73_21435 [Enterobacter cloacae]ECS7453867.1 hypothetical protein [Salmonella enterica]KGB13401.1 hypothetical protein DR74_5065 [Enterobacter cloacae]CUJ11810.1 Uncharacterised protein [Enterobacter cloacae]
MVSDHLLSPLHIRKSPRCGLCGSLTVLPHAEKKRRLLVVTLYCYILYDINSNHESVFWKKEIIGDNQENAPRAVGVISVGVTGQVTDGNH